MFLKIIIIFFIFRYECVPTEEPLVEKNMENLGINSAEDREQEHNTV